jgi:hypothetical protein
MNAPYTFTGDYANAYINRDMAMDERHVYTVHGILSAWPFQNALELGSFCGASSTAFVEAVNVGSVKRATFCDLDLYDPLCDVIRSCRYPNRVRMTREPSWNVLEADEDFDFVLVDANHDLESVTEELCRLTPRRPLCVMAHDTNASAAGYEKSEGAYLLKRTFESMPGYQCIEDCRVREGEKTHRGLFLATTDPELFRLAVEVYRVWR